MARRRVWKDLQNPGAVHKPKPDGPSVSDETYLSYFGGNEVLRVGEYLEYHAGCGVTMVGYNPDPWLCSPGCWHGRVCSPVKWQTALCPSGV